MVLYVHRRYVTVCKIQPRERIYAARCRRVRQADRGSRRGIHIQVDIHTATHIRYALILIYRTTDRLTAAEEPVYVIPGIRAARYRYIRGCASYTRLVLHVHVGHIERTRALPVALSAARRRPDKHVVRRVTVKRDRTFIRNVASKSKVACRIGTVIEKCCGRGYIQRVCRRSVIVDRKVRRLGRVHEDRTRRDGHCSVDRNGRRRERECGCAHAKARIKCHVVIRSKIACYIHRAARGVILHHAGIRIHRRYVYRLVPFHLQCAEHVQCVKRKVLSLKVHYLTCLYLQRAIYLKGIVAKLQRGSRNSNVVEIVIVARPAGIERLCAPAVKHDSGIT